MPENLSLPESDRLFISEAASGEIPEDDPRIFPEDVLFHAIIRMAGIDRAWLVRIAANAKPIVRQQIESVLEGFERLGRKEQNRAILSHDGGSMATDRRSGGDPDSRVTVEPVGKHTGPEPARESHASGPRPHHYLFAHRSLPAHLWQGDSILGILANPENQDFAADLWRETGERLQPGDRLSPEGIRHSSHWIGREHLVILVELPAAQVPPEAQMVAITTSPQIRYLTLERSSVSGEVPEIWMLCEWSARGTHSTYGQVDEPTSTGFLRAVCRLLSIPETLEPPTRQQLQGMKRGAVAMNLTVPEELSGKDARDVSVWERKAQSSWDKGNHDRAAKLYRRVLALRMSRQGPANTLATLAYGNLVQVLNENRRFPEAEALCREWWSLCRRYRMLGHAETMLATMVLAESLRAQGRRQEAGDLMEYRILLAGLSRGADSMVAKQARVEYALFKERNG